MNGDAGLLADELVVGAFVCVLKPPPATHVVDENDAEVGTPRPDIVDQLLQCVPAVDSQAALPVIGVGTDDRDAALLGVPLDDIGLILRRVALVLGGHPHVLRGSDGGGRRSVALFARMSALSPFVALCFARAVPLLVARKKRQGYAKEMTSGLPLVTKPMLTRLKLIRDAFTALAPGAPFVQFTYSVAPPIPKSLPGVSTEASERIWMNLPPARVWVYRKG